MLPSDEVKANRDKLRERLETLSIQITAATASEARSLRAQFDAGIAELKAYEPRIEELIRQEAREAASAKGGTTPRAYTNGPATYMDPAQNPQSPSYFRDLRNSRLGDWAAAERLQRNESERGIETRAGDMTTVAAAGGTFTVPLWLAEEFVALARPGRVTADLTTKAQLPGGVSSINLPKVASGATAAVQVTQNSAVSSTAMTTTSVSTGITTIAGKQIVSTQLLEQSGVPFDRVILGDLAADYAKALDTQVLYGTGANGQLRGLVGAATNTAYTTAAPKVTSATSADSFYNAVIRAANIVVTTRYRPPTALVMHPVRWAWILEGLDSNVRPLISPPAQAPFNNVGTVGPAVAEGSVGTFAGLAVYIDPNVSLTANSATNQDEAYLLVADDLYLYESELRMESFDATYADNASVLFRALGYSAFIPDRLGASVQSIRGTGLVAPTL